MTGRRVAYGALAIGTIACGLAVHLRATALPPALRDVLGDALWAMMLFWCVSLLVPARSSIVRGLLALAGCFMVEASQLMHAPMLDAIRRTTAGHLVLGSGFDLRDLVAYTAGVMAAMIAEAACKRFAQR
jgi:hypothetical protein